MMRKIAVVAGAVGLLAMGTAAFADGPAPKAQTQPAPAASAQTPPDHAHMQGMDHGGQQMHDQMMKDDQQGMANMPATPPKDPAAKKPMKGCCMDKPMAPKGKPMAPKDAKDPAMPMKDM
ncbi:hypothetical protein [Caulobacter flavus]|jgi:hypothetical protein|uniref:hypothetical protein n=1 Tax=Caulobacter flavus TaxID=1679497 RepID=UPI0015DFD005|nr:hypothetical protein [Caulobacter flavus]